MLSKDERIEIRKTWNEFEDGSIPPDIVADIFNDLAENIPNLLDTLDEMEAEAKLIDRNAAAVQKEYKQEIKQLTADRDHWKKRAEELSFAQSQAISRNSALEWAFIHIGREYYPNLLCKFCIYGEIRGEGNRLIKYNDEGKCGECFRLKNFVFDEARFSERSESE